MMMWMWISAIVILLGGELNAEIEHQTVKDSTVGSEKPLGERGAVMADTIGARALEIAAGLDADLRVTRSLLPFADRIKAADGITPSPCKLTDSRCRGDARFRE